MVEAILGDSRFFRRSGPYSLAVVANAARGVVDELELLLQGVAPLQTAGRNEVSFLDNRRYASALDRTSAGAVIVHPDMAARVPVGTMAIRTTEPYAAWARVAALFYPMRPEFTWYPPVRSCRRGSERRSVCGNWSAVCCRGRSRNRSRLPDRTLRRYRSRRGCRP